MIREEQRESVLEGEELQLEEDVEEVEPWDFFP
jgi:hypothetical protein